MTRVLTEMGHWETEMDLIITKDAGKGDQWRNLD